MDVQALAAAAAARLASDPGLGQDDPQASIEPAVLEDQVLEGEQEPAAGDEHEVSDDDGADTNDGLLTVDPEQDISYGGKTAKAKDLFEIKEMATRQTMAAAAQRKEAEELSAQARQVMSQMETFRAGVLEDPKGFTAELVASGLVDRIELARSLFAGVQDNGMSVVELLGLLADDDLLPAEMAERFELDNPSHPARKYAREQLKTRKQTLAERRRVADLERQVASQKPAEPADDAPAAVGGYASETDVTAALADIAATYNLPSDPDLGLEPALAAELIQFAQDNADRYGTDLEKAYLALTARKQAEQAAGAKKAAETAAKVAAKKRAANAVHGRPTSPAGAKPANASGKPLAVADATQLALAQVFGRR